MDNKSIYKSTEETINGLSSATLKVANDEHLNIIGELKKTPRSGKFVRIEKYELNLPVQSLCDHVLQVAFIADFFVAKFELKLNKQLLSDMVACHDLHELIIGDLPDFTPDSHVFNKTKDEPMDEKTANDIIFNSLNKILSERFKTAYETIDKPNSESKILFLSDKIEPIISIWRYVHFFKGQINIDAFNEAMTDFFDNPGVIKYAINDEVGRLINFLQDKKEILKYFHDNKINYQGDIIKKEDLQKLIETREMGTIIS